MPRKPSHDDEIAGDPVGVEGDRVDQVLSLWRQEFPRHDTHAMGVFLRIARIHRDIYRALSTAVAAAVPSVDMGTFPVLLLLRISGPPYEASPSWLTDVMQVYPNHLSNLLDRLRANGLIERRRSATDRRRVAIRLTPKGKKAIEKAFDAHYRTEKRMVAPLTEEELETLATIMRKMVINFEGAAGTPRRRRPPPMFTDEQLAPAPGRDRASRRR